MWSHVKDLVSPKHVVENMKSEQVEKPFLECCDHNPVRAGLGALPHHLLPVLRCWGNAKSSAGHTVKAAFQTISHKPPDLDPKM